MGTADAIKQFALWARAKKIKRPSTKEGMQALFAKFSTELQQTAQHVVGAGGAYHDEITAGDHQVHLIDDGSTIQIADELHEGIYEDDWHRLLRDRAAAAIGPNGELLDDFDQEFQLGQKQHAALQEIAPFTRSNPPSATKTPLGGQATIVATAAGRAQPVSVAYWVGDDAETTPVSCLFSSVVPQLFTNQTLTRSYRPLGIVQFGTRGFLTTLEVDIVNGCQLVVPASMVTLQVSMEQIPANGVVTNLPVTFTGMLSFKPVIRGVPVTKTKYVDNLADTKGADVTIPQMAESFQVFRHQTLGSVNAAMTVAVEDIDGGVLYQQSFLSGVQNAIPFPLSGDAAVVRVANNDGSLNAQDFKVVFFLGV